MDHLCFCVFCFSCFLCLFIAVLWSPAWKMLTFWLLLVMFIVFFFCNFPMWYPGPGVVLDCIVRIVSLPLSNLNVI